jgi:hypothetical protein
MEHAERIGFGVFDHIAHFPGIPLHRLFDEYLETGANYMVMSFQCAISLTSRRRARFDSSARN